MRQRYRVFALGLILVLLLSIAGCQSSTLQQEKPQSKVEETDVVVIGAGGAGLAAAVSAAENGAKVIVLEKMPMVGGNTIRSGGAYNAVDPERQKKQGIEDSIEKHFQQTLEGGDYKAKPELVRVLVENALDGLHWLESMGMKFKDEVYTVLGALWPRSHSPADNDAGFSYIETLRKAAEEKGVKILVETKAEELIMENGRVVGVKATNAEGEELIFKARKGVVLATGGFAANVEMRMKYNENLGPEIPTTNHPGATGDGIVMAEKVGANLIGMEYIQLLPMGDPEDGSLTGWLAPGVEQMIFVNKEGKRFVAEDARRDVMTNALFKQPDALMYVISDHKSFPKGKTSFNEDPNDLIAKGKVIKADTIEELARKINVPPENLKATVEKYNKAVEQNKDEEFGKKLLGFKIDTPPFYASARKPTVHHTMGGVEIDTKARVIGKDGKPIPGLYAAGEVTGGIHGANRLGGNALADVIVFGRIAGESAAKGE
ncbi:MAG: flavocytochrome c [Thermosediminibacteraceae bacterium]|nr:flavocytochrome c [Thermosediminibacteraceae bacterium]